MIVQSFRSVLWVGTVASAAIGCYMVSLRVAAERASLERVETRILLAKRDIRALDTELVTRGRVRQLERWNVDVLALSAPTEGQFLEGEVELASLTAPLASAAATAMMAAARDAESDGAGTRQAAVVPTLPAPVVDVASDETQVRPMTANYSPPEEKARNPLLVRASAPAPRAQTPRTERLAPIAKADRNIAEPAKVKSAKARTPQSDDAKAGAFNAKPPVSKAPVSKSAASKSTISKATVLKSTVLKSPGAKKAKVPTAL